MIPGITPYYLTVIPDQNVKDMPAACSDPYYLTVLPDNKSSTEDIRQKTAGFDSSIESDLDNGQHPGPSTCKSVDSTKLILLYC